MPLENLIGELATKKELNVDFHNHLQTGSLFRIKPRGFKEWFKNLFFDEGFSSLRGVFDKIMNTPVDGVYVTNFNDSRYEYMTSEEQIRIAKHAGYEVEQGQYFTFFKKNNIVKFLGKAQEVPTLQGHALFAQVARNKQFNINKTLDETLAEANDNELKIADHSYARLRGQNGIMASSRTPELDASKVDTFEVNPNFSPVSMPFSIANYLAKKWGRRYNKPVLRNEDGHHPKDIGRTYNIFNSADLKYASEKEFRDSITENARAGNFGYVFKPIPIYRVFHHALMVGLYKLRERMGRNREYREAVRNRPRIYAPQFAY